jgi:hypothetical protein
VPHDEGPSFIFRREKRPEKSMATRSTQRQEKGGGKDWQGINRFQEENGSLAVALPPVLRKECAVDTPLPALLFSPTKMDGRFHGLTITVDF